MTSETKEVVAVTQQAALSPLPVADIKAQVQAIQLLMKDVLQDGTHFGIVPECGDKKVLLKAGAEKLCLMFRLIPSYEIQREDSAGGHRTYTIVTTLSTPSGQIMGQGVGMGSTLESKYRYVSAKRKCPSCGKETIAQSKPEYGGGYYCNAKKGGCGAKFAKGDQSIEGQLLGKVERVDLADTYNTVIKMAKKRSLVDAAISTTGASDIFTQDLEETADIVEVGAEPARQAPAPQSVPANEGPFYYDITFLSPEKYSDAERVLRANKAQPQNETATLWVSPVQINKLKNYVAQEAA